jgi:steroid delta-isomerase-like uncharacterized protein
MTDTNTQDERALCERLVEAVWSRGEVDLVDELVSPDYVEHHTGDSVLEGPEELKAYVEETRAGISGFTKHVEDVVVGDDKVTVRYVATGTHDNEFRGVEPSGNDVEVDGILIYRVEDGRIAEGWEVSDALTLLRQIGALPE